MNIAFDTTQLQVGDVWPTELFAKCGPITEIRPYSGDPEFAVEHGITGVAEFADGTTISLGDTCPGDPDRIARLAYMRARNAA